MCSGLYCSLYVTRCWRCLHQLNSQLCKPLMRFFLMTGSLRLSTICYSDCRKWMSECRSYNYNYGKCWSYSTNFKLRQGPIMINIMRDTRVGSHDSYNIKIRNNTFPDLKVGFNERNLSNATVIVLITSLTGVYVVSYGFPTISSFSSFLTVSTLFCFIYRK